jgi:hypothetical protein
VENIVTIIGLAATIVGATWALRSALSKIETAIAGHVAEDREVHASINARVVKLEGRRPRNR